MHSAASTRWRKAASLRSLARARRLPLGDPAQAGAQHVGIERFQDVVGRTLSQGGDGALKVGVAGHDDDRGVGVGGLELGHELLGGRVRKPAVEDDGGEPAEIGLPEGLGSAADRRDPMVIKLEDIAQVGPRVGIVLDHQDIDRRRADHEAH